MQSDLSSYNAHIREHVGQASSFTYKYEPSSRTLCAAAKRIQEKLRRQAAASVAGCGVDGRAAWKRREKHKRSLRAGDHRQDGRRGQAKKRPRQADEVRRRRGPRGDRDGRPPSRAQHKHGQHSEVRRVRHAHPAHEVPYFKAMNEATKKFHEDVNAKATPAEKAKMGPPYVQAVQALLQAVLDHAGELTPEEKILYEKPIVQYVTQVQNFKDEAEKMMFLTDTFKMCRCSLCYNKDKSKIEVSVYHGPVVLADQNYAPEAWVSIMRFLIRKMNAEKKAGGPPAGNLERALSKKFGLKKKKVE
eukprot:TRINITY_DN13719_c0_g2_i1.p1 TRINITY_DN13719_c0_g2~~TRINITY_DN13719_c0_g2_i1.p1  ORF type:complete len:354 (+),score=61.07 TRINITY_DN13719_c0_g2_i1:154-1062(+)